MEYVTLGSAILCFGSGIDFDLLDGSVKSMLMYLVGGSS